MFHKRMLKEFKETQKYTAKMVFCQWISLLANVLLMLGIAGYLETMGTGQVSAKETSWLLLLLAGALIVRGVMTSQNSRLSFLAGSHVKTRLRDLVYQKLMHLGSGCQDRITTSEAVQISTEGVEQLEIYFGKYMPQFFYSLLAPLTLFVIVGQMNWKIAAVLLFCVPLIPLSIVAVQKFAKKMLNKYWGIYTELGDSFLENLHALTTLKIYQADERYAEKMDEEAEKFRKITMRVLVMQLNSISVMDLVAYGGAAVGILLSILEFQKGTLSFGQCFFILMISAEFFLPLRLLGSFFHIAMNGNAAADRIFALLDTEEKRKGTKPAPKNSDIIFSQVEFGYEENVTIIKNMSLQIPACGMTALVGTSGCGKSTVASLLMKEQVPCHGNIFIGSENLSEIEESELYRKITRINHDSYLFKGTLEENLRMGKEDADITEMESVLRRVDLYDTVLEKGGLSMEIEEKAANLSGGQRQRLALARAILHSSDIYVFDEATSNVDADSENKIMEVIRELAETKAVIVISHRLANVAEADAILVFGQGTIMEQGTHTNLLKKNGIYSGLYKTQQELERYTKDAVREEAAG